MDSSITFQVKTIDGTVIFFSADCFTTVIEAIGTDLLTDAHLILNGQPINVHMTLQHEKTLQMVALSIFSRRLRSVAANVESGGTYMIGSTPSSAKNRNEKQRKVKKRLGSRT
jgi:hypothetical protein